MLVGEQPGDAEDLAGSPFVGPAGKLLDRCLAEAGIDRGRVWVTNAVKHFKWVPRGTRRIHSKPGSMEIAACFPWLEAEIRAVGPRIVRGAGGDGGAGAVWQGLSRDQGSRPIYPAGRGSLRACDRASLGAASRARRGHPASRNPALYR